MRLFDTEVQKLRYRIINELVRLAVKGEDGRAFYEIPKKIAPGPEATMRCCIYKERAIVQERLKQAMGDYDDDGLGVQVIDIACDECPVDQYTVTGACRGCIAHRCMNACPVDAIVIENKKAMINKDKCIECGRCMNACPYKAISENTRPCMKGCKPGAISIDENKKAEISRSKCIECGACVYNCPFGAIVDRSYVLDAIRILMKAKNEGYKVYAAIAPSIVSQFNYAKIEQVVSGLKEMGFHAVVEVALGADIVAVKEARELSEKGFLTSSCCPSFVKYVELNFPGMEKHISHTPSPMIEVSMLIKQTDSSSKVIFIGPCIGKKSEFRKKEYKGIVDCVLTFEELQAMFDGMDIDLGKLGEQSLDNASSFGRIFARSGGLTEAVGQVIREYDMDFDLDGEICDGIDQCRIALLKASKGKLNKNFIEGMVCEGGCINGSGCLHHGPGNKVEVDKYGRDALEKTSKAAIGIWDVLMESQAGSI